MSTLNHRKTSDAKTPSASICPNCGRCSECGHVPAPYYPWPFIRPYPYIQPYPYVAPYNPWPNVIMGVTSLVHINGVAGAADQGQGNMILNTTAAQPWLT